MGIWFEPLARFPEQSPIPGAKRRDVSPSKLSVRASVRIRHNPESACPSARRGRAAAGDMQCCSTRIIDMHDIKNGGAAPAARGENRSRRFREIKTLRAVPRALRRELAPICA